MDSDLYYCHLLSKIFATCEELGYTLTLHAFNSLNFIEDWIKVISSKLLSKNAKNLDRTPSKTVYYKDVAYDVSPGPKSIGSVFRFLKLVASGLEEFQKFYLSSQNQISTNGLKKPDVLILLIEGLLQENRCELLFGLLSSVSSDFELLKIQKTSKNLDEFNVEKVESVILSHVLQRIVHPDQHKDDFDSP